MTIFYDQSKLKIKSESSPVCLRNIMMGSEIVFYIIGISQYLLKTGSSQILLNTLSK